MYSKSPSLKSSLPDMLPVLRLNRPLRFILVFLGSYLLLTGFSLFWIGITSKGNVYWEFAAESLNFVQLFRRFLLSAAKMLCSLLGYETSFVGEYGLRVGTRGIRLVYSCLGFAVMSFYAAFILAWPGTIKQKGLSLLSGLTLIILLNILRLAMLPIIHIEYPQTKNFPIDHHDIFNCLLYMVIAGMLYIRTRQATGFPE